MLNLILNVSTTWMKQIENVNRYRENVHSSHIQLLIWKSIKLQEIIYRFEIFRDNKLMLASSTPLQFSHLSVTPNRYTAIWLLMPLLLKTFVIKTLEYIVRIIMCSYICIHCYVCVPPYLCDLFINSLYAHNNISRFKAVYIT